MLSEPESCSLVFDDVRREAYGETGLSVLYSVALSIDADMVSMCEETGLRSPARNDLL